MATLVYSLTLFKAEGLWILMFEHENILECLYNICNMPIKSIKLIMKIRLILNTLECIHFASYSFLLCLTIFYLLTEAFNPFIFNMPTDIFWFKSTLLLRAICFSYSVFIFLFFFCLFFFFFWIACFPPFCVFLN